jgi:hypothetical protein
MVMDLLRFGVIQKPHNSHLISDHCITFFCARVWHGWRSAALSTIRKHLIDAKDSLPSEIRGIDSFWRDGMVLRLGNHGTREIRKQTRSVLVICYLIRISVEELLMKAFNLMKYKSRRNWQSVVKRTLRIILRASDLDSTGWKCKFHALNSFQTLCLVLGEGRWHPSTFRHCFRPRPRSRNKLGPIRGQACRFGLTAF